MKSVIWFQHGKKKEKFVEFDDKDISVAQEKRGEAGKVYYKSS